METVTVVEVVDAPLDVVHDRVTSVEWFVGLSEYDEVTLEDSTLTIRNSVGLATLELECELLDTDAALAYEQREGIFESMETRYDLAAVENGTEITASTTFSIDVSLIGEILDETIIKRRRRKELETQLAALDADLS